MDLIGVGVVVSVGVRVGVGFGITHWQFGNFGVNLKMRN